MQRPHLIIIAGCNGAGKSTYSHLFVERIIPFDYDKRFLEIYNSMFDSELREEIALNKTTQELENLVESAFSSKDTFCFETNFHVFPVNWINRAKELNYSIEIIFSV